MRLGHAPTALATDDSISGPSSWPDVYVRPGKHRSCGLELMGHGFMTLSLCHAIRREQLENTIWPAKIETRARDPKRRR